MADILPSKSKELLILGADTLLGREVKELVASRSQGMRVRPVVLENENATDEQDGEAVTLETLTPKSLQSAFALLLAGTGASVSLAYDIAKAMPARPVVVDCTGHLESRPEARIVAPLLEDSEAPEGWLLVLAHPVASALVLALTRLERHLPIRSVVANVFAPASERGKPGVSELHQQTTALLNFKPLNKSIFDTQVSFNLLPRLGEDAAHQLLAAESLIERQMATLLSRQKGPRPIPIPSVRLLQAPVFHGFSISLWVELTANARPSEIEEALASAQIEIRRQDEEPPDNVGVASQSGLIAGDVRVDNNNPHAVWIWIVLDNLRSVADAAADLVRTLAAAEGVDR